MDTPFYRSFLVRLWREPPEADGALCGEVESIQSGELAIFQSLDAALALIRQAVGDDRPPAAHSGESASDLTDSAAASL
ncbi:MAG: hypothetical protein H7Y32_15285 [Chloroflexales bacterium]|nr:hypothetical protein [Chloroflexales bacterium]